MENHRHLTDEGLVDVLQRIASSDQMAFREVYHHFHKRLFYFAFALVKTREAAEEVVEDVFIRIWNNKENAAGIKNLKIYLYTATKNTSLNYLSKKARESITEPFDQDRKSVV